MTVTAASFRQGFLGAFGNSDVFPDEAVTFWIAIAGLLLTSRRWGPGAAAASPPTTLLDYATCLFVAHNLILERQAALAAAKGAVPGLNKGPIAGDTVGPVSRAYNAGAALELDAGHWNLTIYGTRFARLANSVGSGPLVVGGTPPPGPWNGGAWAGPVSQWPGFGDL